MQSSQTRMHRGSYVKGGELIQVDIGGHPPIPLGPPPLLLSIFQFLHSLLFLAVFRVLNF